VCARLPAFGDASAKTVGIWVRENDQLADGRRGSQGDLL
jgi:hypothetical protein